MLTGICLGLLHLPGLRTALATVTAGTVWSLIHYRYRLLLPLAFPRAMLGSAFYHGLFGQDLATEWRALLSTAS